MCDHDSPHCVLPTHATDGTPFRSGPTRRQLLAGGAAAGVGGLGLSLLGLRTSAGATTSSAGASTRTAAWRPDPDSPRFSLAVMPDTQYLFDGASIHPAPVQASLRYVLDQQQEHNIVFLAHLGDLTQNGAAGEFSAVGSAFRVFDQAHAAYSVLAGNHDDPSGGDDQRGNTPYLSTFGPARFAGSPSYRGSTPDGYNSYHVFRAAGREWLVFALDWRTSDGNIPWIKKVMARHPSTPVILTTHDLVGSYDDGGAGFDEYGQHLWDEFIAESDQIFLCLNGHYWGPGRTVMQNKAGHDVHLHITNYQNRYYGGAAMIRLYHFDLERNVIDVETFSPYLLAIPPEKRNLLQAQEVELSGDVDRFTLEIDFVQRFSGFAPVPPRPARSAASVVIPGTVAYWRFDGGTSGVVPVNTRVRDRSGHGNDLVIADRPGRAADALSWTTDHHPDQPAHSSLVFRGGRNAGDYLHTLAGAALNTSTFSRGYTIEAFFRIPADWSDPDNGFAGLLSRAGTGAEAGKGRRDGDGDPQEPPATLSLSGDRELQWAIWPLNSDGMVTNWGHELPLDQWWHVAVVNDARRSRVYVDGCEVVRNPDLRSTGIATVGQQWLVGAVQYAGKLNQVLYATLGDVRVVERALRVEEFMIG